MDLYGSAIAVGTALGDAESPDVAWGPTGVGGSEYLVVWIENELADLVFAQRVDSASALVGDATLVSNRVGTGQFEPGVVFASGSNAWWIVWSDSG